MEEKKLRRTEKEALLNEYDLYHIDSKKYKSYFETINKVVDKIDFKKIQSIFEQIGKKSGIKPEDLNLLDLSRIHLIATKKEKKQNLAGGYSPISNQILLDVESILENAWGLSEQKTTKEGVALISQEALELSILATYIHEQVHAISYNRIEELDPKLITNNKIIISLLNFFRKQRAFNFKKIKSGYSENEIKINKENKNKKIDIEEKFKDFDEAVTERLTFEILQRYMQEDMTKEQVISVLNDFFEKSSYQKHIAYLNSVIRALSKTTELSEETVWYGIIRSKLEGINFDNPEIEKIFNKKIMSDTNED